MYLLLICVCICTHFYLTLSTYMYTTHFSPKCMQIFRSIAPLANRRYAAHKGTHFPSFLFFKTLCTNTASTALYMYICMYNNTSFAIHKFFILFFCYWLCLLVYYAFEHKSKFSQGVYQSVVQIKSALIN